ncbi:uncharacterized protein BXZ73DRAFT_91530 [Epithele typhae]|uniref:uncharacterized protein n=1 Tax=Epithele typhae TaxID=378194 RepID=UPI0020080825|nr:uncharacterized protein BXZ73DRAFT_91530 [Epithele typhae]KAH9922807.1 hypothetical protein BXZ73DRAFT_91530 [Epithele typhae]
MTTRRASVATIRARAHYQPEQPSQEDEFGWLKQAAPQFHTQPDALPSAYVTSSDARSEDDSGDESGSDSDGSNSSDEEDPMHPYNVQDAQPWHNDGRVAYMEQDEDDCFPGAPTIAIDDVPYVPPASPTGYNGTDVPVAPEEGKNPYAAYNGVQRSVSPYELHAPSPYTPASSPSPPRRAPRRAPGTARRTTGGRTARSYLMQQEEEEEEEDDSADADAEYEESDADSEDDYMPSPRTKHRTLGSPRRNAKEFKPYASPSPTAPKTKAKARAQGRRAASRAGHRSQARNIQSDEPVPRKGERYEKVGPMAWTCKQCGFVQKNQRAPDMERHIATHFRDRETRWVCCGVPVEEAAEHGVYLAPGSNPLSAPGAIELNGRIMVGGCQLDFSRQDALKRHWKNRNIGCVGDIIYSKMETRTEME